MSYRFVQAAVDDGRARGPRLALVVHMAQGGGTVEFLSKPNRDGVSVHYVIRYTGEIVQMLDESHMHTSIRTSAIRTTDDPDGFYGRTEIVLAMGTWADTRLTLGPNHASLAVEIEGFAADGPNKAQQDSLERLVTDIRTRFQAIALLGHRDFQDYKACPGHLIPWDRLGGHGKGDATEVVAVTKPEAVLVDIPADTKILNLDGTVRIAKGGPRTGVYSPFTMTSPGGTALRAVVWTHPTEPDLLLAVYGTAVTDVRPIPDAALKLVLDHVQAGLTDAQTALNEARPR